MLLPRSLFLRVWNAVIFSTVTAYAVEIPVRLVFGYDPPAWLNDLDALGSVLFGVDVVMQFFTARMMDGKMISDREVIATEYVRGWFFFDLIAALPVDRMFLAMGTALGFSVPGLALASRFVRMLRLLRIVHLVGLLRGLQRHSSMHPGLLRMAILGFWILLAAHWVAAGWLWILGIPADRSLFLSYLNALYWVVTTIATVGYGDITPDRSNPLQLIYTMCVMVFGVGVYGYLIGNMATMIANLDVARAQHQEKMARMTAFLKYRNLPATIQTRIRDYYNYIWETRRGYDESSIIMDLPDSLKTDVSLYLNTEIVEKVPMFRGGSSEFIRELVIELRPVIYLPDEYIFRKDEFGDRMYFISKGRVEVVSPDGVQVYASLGEGAFFGEMALVFDQPRTASARAADYCDLYYLDKSVFDRVLNRFPEFKKSVLDYAEIRRTAPGGTGDG